MYPVLLDLGKLRLNTYDVTWLVALSLAILWSVRRFVLYGFTSQEDDANARKVIAWSFIAMLFGARAFEYIVNFQDYLDDPSLLLDLNYGSLSEIGAFCGAFIAAAIFCRCKKISLARLCGVVALPAFLTIAIGRWGCFLNGCCVGITVSSASANLARCFAVHFPRDSVGVLRHPTQLYYSISAIICLAVLRLLERKLLRKEILLDTCKPELVRAFAAVRGGVITSIGLILLTTMRLTIDPLRAITEPDGLALSHGVLLTCLPLEIIWLAVSLKRLKRLEA